MRYGLGGGGFVFRFSVEIRPFSPRIYYYRPRDTVVTYIHHHYRTLRRKQDAHTILLLLLFLCLLSRESCESLRNAVSRPIALLCARTRVVVVVRFSVPADRTRKLGHSPRKPYRSKINAINVISMARTAIVNAVRQSPPEHPPCVNFFRGLIARVTES